MVMRRITLKNFCKKKAKSFVFRGMITEVSGRAECELHPLIHTLALATMVLHFGTSQKKRECGLKYVI